MPSPESLPLSPMPWAEAWDAKMERWRQMRRARNADPTSSALWNSLDIWEEYERYTAYPGQLLEPVQAGLEACHTVLDIGAGSGSLAIPLAKRAEWLTAVEPSAAQCARLGRAMEAAARANFTILNQDWESVALEDLGRPDLVVASYCLFMPDIVGAIDKMCRVARRRICLVHLASHDLSRTIRAIRPADALVPNHEQLVAVLHEMGLRPRVSLFTRSFMLPLELQLNMFRAAQGFDEAEIDRMQAALAASERLEIKDGQVWLKRTFRDALIEIDKTWIV